MSLYIMLLNNHSPPSRPMSYNDEGESCDQVRALIVKARARAQAELDAAGVPAKQSKPHRASQRVDTELSDTP